MLISYVLDVAIKDANSYIERMGFNAHPEELTIRLSLGRQKGHSTWIKNKLESDKDAILLIDETSRRRFINLYGSAKIKSVSIEELSKGSYPDKLRGLRLSLVIVDRGIMGSSNRLSDINIIGAYTEIVKYLKDPVPLVILGN